jgi:hypothetical protein
MTEDPAARHSDGVAGKSARDEYQRRRTAREKRLTERFGAKLGMFILFAFGDARSTAAWDKGSKGEVAVGKALDEIATEGGYFVLHDRQIPRSKANIDHILISDRGVFVIDAKYYKGLIEIRDVGGLFTTKEILFVSNRNQTKLVESVKKQVAIVEIALKEAQLQIPLFGMLAFVAGDFPIFFKPKEIDGVLINGKGIKSSVLARPRVSGIDLKKANVAIIQALPAK